MALRCRKHTIPAMQKAHAHMHTTFDRACMATCRVHCREYIKPDGSIGLRSTRGWYARVDNNGWRPVVERVLLGAEADDAMARAARVKAVRAFHHNPAVRRWGGGASLSGRSPSWMEQRGGVELARLRGVGKRKTPCIIGGARFCAVTRYTASARAVWPDTKNDQPQGGAGAAHQGQAARVAAQDVPGGAGGRGAQGPGH